MADPVRNQQHFAVLRLAGAYGVFRVWRCAGQSELQHSRFGISSRTQALDLKSLGAVAVVFGPDDLAT